MAWHSKDTEIFFAHIQLSRGIVTDASIDDGTGDFDVTTIGDKVERFDPDPLGTGSLKLAGFYYRSSTVNLDAAFRAAMQVKTGSLECPIGSAAGNPAELIYGNTHNRIIPASVRDLLRFTIDHRADGGVLSGVMVQGNTQVTGNGAGTSVDRGVGAPTAVGWVAVCHMLELVGSNDLVVRPSITHSATDSGYATLQNFDFAAAGYSRVIGVGPLQRYLKRNFNIVTGTLTRATFLLAIAAIPS